MSQTNKKNKDILQGKYDQPLQSVLFIYFHYFMWVEGKWGKGAEEPNFTSQMMKVLNDIFFQKKQQKN